MSAQLTTKLATKLSAMQSAKQSTKRKGQKPSKCRSSIGDGKTVRLAKRQNEAPVTESTIPAPAPRGQAPGVLPLIVQDWEKLAQRARTKYCGDRIDEDWAPPIAHNAAILNLETATSGAVRRRLWEDVHLNLRLLHINSMPTLDQIVNERTGTAAGVAGGRVNDSRVFWWLLDACAQALGRGSKFQNHRRLLMALCGALMKGTQLLDRMSPSEQQPREVFLAAVIVFAKFLHNFLETLATAAAKDEDAHRLAALVDKWADNCDRLYVPSAVKIEVQGSS